MKILLLLFFLTPFVYGQRATQQLGANPDIVGLWHLNELSGLVAYDNSGNNHHGTIDTPTRTDPCLWGACRTFDGNNDRITIPDHDDFTFGDGTSDYPFSVTFWAWLPILKGAPNGVIVKHINAHGGGEAGGEWRIYFHYGMIYVMLSDPSSGGRIQRAGLNVATAEEWFWVAVTYSGNSNKSGVNIYRNGIFVPPEDDWTVNYTAMENTDAPVLFAKVAEIYFEIKIEEVSIWKKELTKAEIVHIYQSRAKAYQQ